MREDVKWPHSAAEQQGFYSAIELSRWRRLMLRLFPYATRPRIPERAGVTSEVHVRLDWLDRLRALVSGHVLVVVSVDTDTPVGRVLETRSSVCVVAPGEPT